MYVKRPILVTGTHRSGSTWVGQLLAAAPGTGYVHEPFNIDIRMGPARDVFDYWFQYVGPENQAAYADAIADVFQFRYPLKNNLRKANSIHEGLKLLKDQGLFWLYRLRGALPVVKDPIAFFSAEWMARQLDLSVVVLIRHPAAFCSSLKLMNWQFDFSHFAQQPLLLEGYLNPFADEIRLIAAEEKPLLAQAVLFWNCIHHTIRIYRERHPDWLFIRHEDLSASPVEAFQKLYTALGLPYTAKAKARIDQRSGVQNAREHQSNNEFVRNSRANIDNWKRRLTPAEIEFVRAETAAIAQDFYSDKDW